jgi:flagellar protein FlaJ
MVLVYLPLVAAFAVLCLFVLVPYSDTLDRTVSRVSFSLFGGLEVDPESRRERLLRTAAIGTPYREYATRTRLYILGSAIASTVVGAYLAFLVIEQAGLTESLTFRLPRLGVFSNAPRPERIEAVLGAAAEAVSVRAGVVVAVLVSAALFGAIGGAAAYLVRWNLPSVRADTRRRQIDAGMPRMVAFVYALTRGGMSFPDVMRALSRNEGVFGESATEIGVAVRSIDLFSVDLVTAIRETSRRTPSNQFEQFSENLGSVLQSGGNISEFLRNQYERYREEAEEQQREILDLLATTAEVYVTVVVAGMLFLITILFIIGVVAGNTLFSLQVITYVVLPAVNLIFVAYLADVTQPLRISRDSGRVLIGGEDGGNSLRGVRSDGGYLRPNSRVNHGRLHAHQRIRSLRDTVASPLQSMVERPILVLYVTVPIAVGVTLYRLPTALSAGGFDVRVADDLVIQAVLFLMATFTLVYEVSKRRLRRLEESVPDLLDRLASLNEAGTAVVSSFDRVRQSDLGPLDEEVERIWRDIQWGATVEQALDRFESRVQTSSVTRVVTLITNAMRASNEIGPVLRIAAEQARADQRLRRQRRQEMLTYLVVIYISFLVFLVVIVAIDYVLIPNLPDTSGIDSDSLSQAPGVIGGIEGGDVPPFRLVFFHAALIQSLLSGLVGGMMGGGSIKDGVKHATVMLTITYVVLTLLG